MPTNSKRYQKKWLDKNPEYMKEWRKKNKEKILEYHKQWEKEHPGYMSESVQVSRKKRPEYYKEQKRFYARRKRLENKLEREGNDMKFRNRGKHGFKRLKRQTQVYEYCKTNIKNGKTFTLDDISKDTNIPRSTLVELLNELQDKMNDTFIYQRGYIEIKGLGNNGVGKRAEDVKGLKVYKIPKSTRTRNEKIQKIYDYLSDLASKDKPLPCLSELTKKLDIGHVSTVMEILKQMDRDNKIIYQHGKIIAVNVPDVKADKEKRLVYTKQEKQEPTITLDDVCTFETYDEEPVIKKPTVIETTVQIRPECLKETPSVIITDTERYDKAVKDLVADYIINAAITTREEVLEYVDAIYKITDKLKDKLY